MQAKHEIFCICWDRGSHSHVVVKEGKAKLQAKTNHATKTLVKKALAVLGCVAAKKEIS